MFRNILYIDVEAVPEFPENETIQRRVFSPDFQERLARLREERFVDYAAVTELKRTVLEELYQHFREAHLANDTPRALAASGRTAARGRRRQGAGGHPARRTDISGSGAEGAHLRYRDRRMHHR